MDGSQYTFDSLPRVIGATLGIVCLVLLVAFRSLLVPIRAVLCLVWMLVVTFGSAVLIYQDGALEGLGMGSFAPSEGAIFWMSPDNGPSGVVTMAQVTRSGGGTASAMLQGRSVSGDDWSEAVTWSW